MTAYYNEIDTYAAQWLRNLIAEGLIAHGHVDERSIVDVQPAEVRGFTQAHFFAGIAGWPLAARLAGWPDDRSLWTGSCPCQPFSVAGKGEGTEDKRHLWPDFFRLIAGARPDVVMGEQVAAAVGKSWLDGVCTNLESIGYAFGAVVVPACAVDAPHRRDRLWFVADSDGNGTRPIREGLSPRQSESSEHGDCESLADSDFARLERRSPLRECGAERTLGAHGVADAACGGDGRRAPEQIERQAREFGNRGIEGALVYDPRERRGEGRPEYAIRSGQRRPARSSFWRDSIYVTGADGKARRVKPGIRLLAHGIPARVGKLRAFGNAIVPQVAAEIIGAYLDCAPNPARSPAVLIPPPY